jgi:hypothetical protein
MLPSFEDLFFLVLLVLLALTPLKNALLRDADIGWHIRTGELILTHHAIPHADPFSYTRPNAAWYATEWLYEAWIAAVHHFYGLEGVVLFTAFLLAAIFALLFHFLLRRSGNLLVAVGLTLMAMAAAQVHMLARPHVAGWLIALLWMETLCRFAEGERLALLALPPLMVLWVNVHGGFVLGVLLLMLFSLGSLWAGRTNVAPLGVVFLLCVLATLANPYGYRLIIHVYQYLSDSFLMNSIEEFASPNFHVPVYGYFELWLVLAIAVAAWKGEAIAPAGWAILLFSIVTGLYSVRNIPVSAILMSMVLARPLALAADPTGGRQPAWLASLLTTGNAISNSLLHFNRKLHGHVLVWAVIPALIAYSHRLAPAHFDDQLVPVDAVAWIARQNIRDHLFSTDAWSGYLIYRLYPGFHVYFDDRHDFYGRAFVQEYATAVLAARDWRAPFDRYHVRWALLPVNSPLACVMRESQDWRVTYEDRLAVVFSRQPHP